MVVDFVAVAIPLAQTQTSRGRIVSHLREITKEATLRVLETPLMLVQVVGSWGNPIAYRMKRWLNSGVKESASTARTLDTCPETALTRI